MNDIKIAHIQVIPQMSGVQQISLDILKSIDCKDKYIICGCPIEGSSFFYSDFENAGVKIITLPEIKREIGFHDLVAIYKLYKIFKKHKFDIVHTNSTKPAIVGRIAARLAGIDKIIHTVHGIAFHRYINIIPRYFYWFIENVSTLFGDINVTVNKFYLKEYKFVKSEVIYNGVDFSKLNLESINKEAKKGELIIAFMARLDEQKNPIAFINIANEVIKSYCGNKKLKFIIGGNGELESTCHSLINSYGLQDYFQFEGWVRNKSDFLGKVDILVQPSKWEAFGLIFVEAGYLCTPVVATNVEGIPEVVIDNQTGLLFEDGNITQAAQNVLYLLNNDDEREQIGLRAQSYVVNKFSLNKMVKKYISLYTTNCI